MRMATTAAGPRLGALWARWSRLTGTAARRHWLLTLLLLAGLVLRIVTQIAYRPALFYIDTVKYLFGAYPGNDPPGYQFFLKPFLVVGTLQDVAILQHLLGLGMAIAIYALLLRRGSARWLAALAAAPVLLDGYQLQMEQTVMPDVLFEALLVAGMVVLLWHNKPRVWMLVVAGLLLGATAPMWEPGEILILPALIYAAIMASGWRARVGHALLIGVAFLVPILLVCARNQLALKHFSLAPYAGSTIYGRAAWAADCATLKLPAYERPLCVSHAEALKIGGPDGLDHSLASPLKHVALPPGMAEHSIATNFAKRVIEQQPLRVIGSILGDSIKLFEVDRVTSPGDTPISRWQFQRTYPQFWPYVTLDHGKIQFGELNKYEQPEVLDNGNNYGAGSAKVITPLAVFLRHYQLDGGFTPGPLLLFTLITGLIGSAFLLLRRKLLDERHWETARACFFVLSCGVLVLMLSDAFEFSWRYQLPALMTLPPAGALGLTVIAGYFTKRRQDRAPGARPVTSAGPADAAPADAAPAAAVSVDAASEQDAPTADAPAAAPSAAPVPESAGDG
jgi:hypothetical protein